MQAILAENGTAAGGTDAAGSRRSQERSQRFPNEPAARHSAKPPGTADDIGQPGQETPSDQG